jgi:hypothetical protein
MFRAWEIANCTAGLLALLLLVGRTSRTFHIVFAAVLTSMCLRNMLVGSPYFFYPYGIAWLQLLMAYFSHLHDRKYIRGRV